MSLVLPPTDVVDAIHGPVTRVTRRIDIYEPDRETLFYSNAGIIDGSVSIDISRPERRAGAFTLDNLDGDLDPNNSGGFWYDKIIKVYRGVIYSGGDWETQIAELTIDDFDAQRHPGTLKITCRDYAARLLGSKVATSTTYPENHPIEEAIRDIAISGGLPIEQIDLPLTGESLGHEYVIEQETDRWAAMNEVAQSYNYELFFTADGMLTMREFADPYLEPAEYTFQTGPTEGNLVDYNHKATLSRLRNHIVAVGESADQVPVFGEAVNDDPTSPTNTTRLGVRTEFYKSAFIETVAQAEEVANRKLKYSALEQYDVSLQAIVAPYIDAGIIVGFSEGGPADEYLLQQVNIPMLLEPMTANAGRVINLGV